MMGRPKNETIWKNFHRSESSNEVSCSHCEQRYKFANVNKMAKHLITCIKCPLLIKQRVQDMLATNVTISKIHSASDSPPSSDLHMHLPSNLAQYNLAKAIFVTGASLAVVEHPLWKEFCKDLHPHFKTPTRKAISSTYLDKIYNEMSMDITLQLKAANFLHIQCDGWSNIRNEGVVNFLISKPETVFVKSLSTQANRHTAQYVSQEIIEIMKEYGEQKFFVLIGDNAANMQKAFKIVKEAYPNVVPMGCVAHIRLCPITTYNSCCYMAQKL